MEKEDNTNFSFELSATTTLLIILSTFQPIKKIEREWERLDYPSL